MKLKDADALKAEFTEDSPVLWHYTGIWAVIDNAPTIDAKPVVHGHWTTKRTHQHNGEYYCSCCGFEAFWTWRRDVQSLTDYCPNCGAKMERQKRKEVQDGAD